MTLDVLQHKVFPSPDISWPPSTFFTTEAKAALENIKAQKEKEMSAAFSQYLGFLLSERKNRCIIGSIHVSIYIKSQTIGKDSI
jgi:hypothetical protein